MRPRHYREFCYSCCTCQINIVGKFSIPTLLHREVTLQVVSVKPDGPLAFQHRLISIKTLCILGVHALTLLGQIQIAGIMFNPPCGFTRVRAFVVQPVVFSQKGVNLLNVYTVELLAELAWSHAWLKKVFQVFNVLSLT